MCSMIKASAEAFMYVFEDGSGLRLFMIFASALKPPGGKDTAGKKRKKAQDSSSPVWHTGVL